MSGDWYLAYLKLTPLLQAVPLFLHEISNTDTLTCSCLAIIFMEIMEDFHYFQITVQLTSLV